MAQSVEQLIRNQQVAGSSPASSSKKFLFFGTGIFLSKPTGLVCNRHQVYVISSYSELYVIKPQGLDVSSVVLITYNTLH